MAMQNFRFDNKDILYKVLVDLLNKGVEEDRLDTVLSRMGPVDLDLMQECLHEIFVFNALQEETAIAA